MIANSSSEATPLTEEVVAWLRARLPRGWQVSTTAPPPEQGPLAADARITLQGPHGTGSTIVVEEKRSLSPRAVLNQISPRVQSARSMGAHLPLLVVAPWISERTQSLLAEAEVNYLDLTGNGLLRIDNPPIFLQTVGARRNPSPPRRAGARLQGAKASRVIRLLADIRPPYGVRAIAAATGLNPGYVSRLIEALYEEGLIEREARGPVREVDVPALLRRWAQGYDTFKSNRAEGFVAPGGLEPVLARMAADPGLGTRAVISGSVAAARLAPIASPALLLLYYEPPRQLALDLDLLPTEEGANVIVLTPFDRVVYDHARIEAGLRYAAPSQIAVDCLAGNGRMPVEGEALLAWMAEEESSWRLPQLAGLGDGGALDY